MNKETLQQLENSIQYHFKDSGILDKALTHSSVAATKLDSNERLEFLGDSILGVVICEALFEKFPQYLEGDLTKIKSMLVSRKTCAKLADTLGLAELMKVGPGMENSKSLKGSIAAGALESIIAAIYSDGGFDAAAEFILRLFAPLIDQADAKEHHENYKSVLQQHAQQVLNSNVVYELLDEKGPDHDKCFETAAVLAGKRYPSAWGTNKKEAQQMAAAKALIELGLIKEED